MPSGVKAGQAYVDVGTLHGYRKAIALLSAEPEVKPSPVSPTKEVEQPHEIEETSHA